MQSKEALERQIVDVVVIGAGPSGAVATKRLAQAGLRVICLEQGDYPDYASIDNQGLDFEYTKDKIFGWNPNKRHNEWDYPIDESESSVGPLMWNGVGGGSVIYAAHWHRFRPSDFRVKALDGVGDDWPFTYEDLAPFYDRVSEDFSVSGVAGDPAWPDHEIPLPPFAIREYEKRMIKAQDKLGWHWWPGVNAIATVKHRHLQACVRRGACMWGCADEAKASVDRTHWPDAIGLGATLITNARVAKLITDAQNRVTEVEYYDRISGRLYRQRAQHFILCTNGIGTPRLLLNSADVRNPGGLSNSSGLVGKRLMMHPYGLVMGLVDEFVEGWQGPWGLRIYSMQFGETQKDCDFVRGAKWISVVSGGPYNSFGSFPWGDEGAWGSQFCKTVSQRFGHAIGWSFILEDLPEETNRVILDPSLKDANGIPAPKLIYKNSENTRKLMRFQVEQATLSLRTAGAHDIFEAPFVRDTGWHLLGTCKMGDVAKNSVVNQYGQSFDNKNLYIMDGSVMPTSSCLNPTATIAALALRSAEHLANELTRGA